MPMPPHQPTDQMRKQVEALAAYGVPETDISLVIGIDPKTLRKYYRDQLDTAHTKANSKVAERLFQQAMEGNTTAMIFWLKTRARWRETSEVIHRHEITKEQLEAEMSAMGVEPDELWASLH